MHSTSRSRVLRSSPDKSIRGEVFNVFLCFIFWGEVEDFIVNELIFEMFLLESVVDFVFTVDDESNVEVAVDWLCGDDDTLEKCFFEGGVL